MQYCRLVFAALYAILVSTVYFVELTVVIPRIFQGSTDKVALLREFIRMEDELSEKLGIKVNLVMKKALKALCVIRKSLHQSPSIRVGISKR